jgi:hypothetical protein
MPPEGFSPPQTIAILWVIPIGNGKAIQGRYILKNNRRSYRKASGDREPAV